MQIKAPHPLPDNLGRSIFLAGSIEMGTAIDWQKDAARRLEDAGWTVFNPRRDDWDPTWEQKKTNPDFRQQVEWELQALSRAQAILIYFVPGTMSPISLLEFGLHARRDIVVVCPEGFWRKGNIDITAEYYGVKLYETLEEALEHFGATYCKRCDNNGWVESCYQAGPMPPYFDDCPDCGNPHNNPRP